MNRLVCILLFLLGLATTANAQEKVVTLEKGMTVWHILKNEGCQTKEIAVLWPLVVKDSGLNPDNDRTFPVGQLIAIKRGCDGQPLENLQTKSLATELAQAKKTLDSLRDDADLTIEGLQKENRALREKLAQSAGSSSRNWIAVPGVLFLLLIFMVFRSQSQKRQINKMKTDAEKTEAEFKEMEAYIHKMATNVQFPQKIEVEHWGKYYTIELEVRPGSQQIGYPCPFCNDHDLIFRPDNVESHFRRVHPEEGRVTAEVEERTFQH